MFLVQPCNRVRLGFLFLSLQVWLLCAGATAPAQSKPQSQEGSDKAAEIKKLLKERCDLLEEVVAVLSEQYKAGTVDFSKVAQAVLEALRATLDVVDGPEKRVTVLQQHQKIVEVIVQSSEARFKAGLCGRVELLQAKALLLEVRIELLREQQKAKPHK